MVRGYWWYFLEFLGMPQNFIVGDADQVFLLPVDMAEWLPEDDLVWTVMGAVDALDLSAFTRSYRHDGHGRAAYHPQVMVRLLIYAYAVGVRSSREIERRCVRDVGFRVLAGNLLPDHATIARFRSRHQRAFEAMFAQVLALCAEAGLVSLGQISVDGTKIAANASWSKNRTEAALGHLISESQAQYEAIARELTAAHEATDAAEDAVLGEERDPDPLPRPLRSRAGRVARLREAKQRLTRQREAAEAAAAQKVADWHARNEATGRPGRKPSGKAVLSKSGKPPRVNTTDPDSAAMRCQHTLVQGFNAQLAVTTNQVIVGALLTKAPTDQHLLHPVVDAACDQLRHAGVDPDLDVVLADAQYANEANFAQAHTGGFQLLAPIVADAKRLGLTSSPRQPHGRNPNPDPERYPATTAAQTILASEEGRKLYSLRGRTVEPVFGQIKNIQKFRQFSRRGLPAVTAEWFMICTAHNIRKLHTLS